MEKTLVEANSSIFANQKKTDIILFFISMYFAYGTCVQKEPLFKQSNTTSDKCEFRECDPLRE